MAKYTVSDKELERRKKYQDYLTKHETSRPQGMTRKDRLKSAKSYYQWKKESESKNGKSYGAIGAMRARTRARNKAIEEGTGRKIK